MWLYYCTFVLFSHIVLSKKSFDNTKISKTLTNEDEIAFTDVLKNISRVNTVLQDLIKNYEQLKQLHESNENTSQDEESDSEVDEVFKGRAQALKGPISTDESSEKQTTSSDNSNLATQMYWSVEGGNKYDKDVDDETASSTQESNESEVKMAEKSDIILDTNASTKDFPINEELKTVLASKVVKYLTKKTPDVALETKSKTQIEVIKSNLTTNDNINENSTQNEENSSNNTTKLTPHKLVRDDNTRPSKINTIHKRARNDTEENLSNFMEEETEKSEKQPKTEDETEDGDLSQEELKTDILRSAYGDACLKLVVEKCRKACVAAEKAVCHIHVCKSNFKEEFKKHYTKDCKTQFRSEKKNYDKCGENKRCAKRKKKLRDKDAVYPEDMTRSGYIAASCLPPSRKQALLTKTSNNTKSESKLYINILRDKYETACKKISAGKCKRACNYAFAEACKVKNCNNDFKKNFKRECKYECNRAYKLQTTYTSSSNSDYSSDYSDW